MWNTQGQENGLANGTTTQGEQCWAHRYLYRPVYPLAFARISRKSAGSMDVRPYFSKYGHRVFGKYRNRNVNECDFVARKADHRALMGSYRSLTFAYFKLFLGLKCRPVLIGQKSLLNQ